MVSKSGLRADDHEVELQIQCSLVERLPVWVAENLQASRVELASENPTVYDKILRLMKDQAARIWYLKNNLD